MTITTEEVAKQQRINRVERALLDIGFCANAIRAKVNPERYKGKFSKAYAGPVGTLDIIRENVAHFRSFFSAYTLKMADRDLCTVAALMQRREIQHWLKAADILDGIESYLRISLNSPMHGAESEELTSAQPSSEKPLGKKGGSKAKRPGVDAAVLAAIQKNPEIAWTVRKLALATKYAVSTVGESKAWKNYQKMRDADAFTHTDTYYGSRHVDNMDIEEKTQRAGKSLRIASKRRGRTGSDATNDGEADHGQWTEELLVSGSDRAANESVCLDES